MVLEALVWTTKVLNVLKLTHIDQGTRLNSP